MKKTLLGQKIFSVSYLKGSFRLRSGLFSKEYFDKYRFESSPFLLKGIAKQLSDFVPEKTEVLAGLELGGIPLAVALSLETGLPVVFVRKKAKDYGTCQIVEGLGVSERNVCVIEDVITTGGQVRKSVEDLREKKAIVQSVLCVVLRGEKKSLLNSMKNSNLSLFSLFDMEELKALGK